MTGTPPGTSRAAGHPTTGAGDGLRGPPGPALSREQLADLAARAVREGPGSVPDVRLRAIREQRLLEQVAASEDAPWAAELARDWDTARREVLDLLALHASPSGRVGGDAEEVIDACAVQLLTDPDAPGRVRRRLREGLAGRQPPPLFDAALDPEARVGRLLAAALLLPQLPSAGPSGVAQQDVTQPIPQVERTPPPTGVSVGSAGGGVRRRVRPRVAGALVAPSLALLVAAAGLRWPVATASTVLAWVVVDRVASLLADPFLRLVGGWPPTIRGWAVVGLPFRLVGVLLRGPWRLLGGVLLVLLWGVAVDRGLTWLHGLLDGPGSAMDATGFAARWFVPVAAAGMVWQITRRRGRRPALRGGAAVGAGIRALPGGRGGLLVLPAVALFLLAATAPAERPWAPHDDHRAALAALLPAGWDAAAARGWAWSTGWLPGVADPPVDPPPADTPEVATWQVVDASALNVRRGPGTAEPIIDSLAAGEVVEGTGRTETVEGALWVEVRLTDGGTGWAAGRFLTEIDP